MVDKFTALMQKRVAGVPVSVIALVVALGALWFSTRLTRTPDDDTDAATIDEVATDVPDLTDSQPPIFTANSPSQVGSVTGFAQDSNDAWMRRGVEWLNANQSVNPAVAQTALLTYLNGETGTYAQGQMVAQVIKQFGLPPELPSQPGEYAPKPSGSVPPPKVSSYGTTAVIVAPTTARDGKYFSVSGTIKAVDPKAGRPTGTVEIFRGDNVYFKGTLPASGVVRASVKIDAPKGGKLYSLGVRFTGSGKWKDSVARTSVTVR